MTMLRDIWVVLPCRLVHTHLSKFNLIMQFETNFNNSYYKVLPIRVAERSKARVYGRSHAGIAGSNPAGCMDVCLLLVLRVVR